jgi:hypothetical protein
VVEQNELTGRRLADRYWLEAPVRRGPHTTRYRAVDLVSGRDVSVEVLSAPAPNAAGPRELSAIGVRHPNVAEMYARGVSASGEAFVVLEAVRGELLSQRMAAAGSLQGPEAVEIAASIALGLAALHARGLIHGALSAEGVLISESAAGGRAVKLVELVETRPGDPAVDIAALGGLVHAMLAGSKAKLPALESVTARAREGGFAGVGEFSSALWWALAQARTAPRGSTEQGHTPRIARSLGAGLILGMIMLFGGIAMLQAVSGERSRDARTAPAIHNP